MHLDFLVIGAPKAGTTWAWKYLDEHQRFFVPGAKDTYYFDRHYRRGEQWYKNHFSAAAPRQLIGEVCHDYMYSAEAIARIQKDVSETCRIVLILREPVSRAASQARYGYQMSHISGLRISTVLSEDPSCLTRSRYEQFLPLIIKTFGVRLEILLYEDLVADPLGFAKQLATACSGGAVSHGEQPLPGAVNAAAQPRSKRLMRLIRLGVRLTDRLGQRRLIGAIKSSRLRGLLFRSSAAAPNLRGLEERLAVSLRDSVAKSTELIAAYRPSVRTAWQEVQK